MTLIRWEDISAECAEAKNMESCLQRFAEYYADASAGRSTDYLARNYRLIFLAYLKEYMSIYGFCYIDSKNTDMRRMDIIAEISDEQYVIEFRTARNDRQYKDEIYQQFADYLESKDKTNGYLALFDLQHDAEKDSEGKYIDIDGRKIFEIIV